MSEIRITLLSDLCAASGASMGNAIDTDVAMDRDGIPYLPARRLRGCLRYTAEELCQMGCEDASPEKIAALFGTRDGKAGALIMENAQIWKAENIRATLRLAAQIPALKTETSPSRVANMFTYVRGSTAMEEGVAKEGSLRYVRVVDQYSPLYPQKETMFTCKVRLSDPSLEKLLVLCCQATRHIGSNRNRGLGEVKLEYIADANTQKSMSELEYIQDTDRVRLEYHILLSEPVISAGLDERLTSISSRAVIGCLSHEWLKTHTADDPEFNRLFLSGEAQWQELTPVADGRRSIPAPRMLAKTKEETPRFINLLEFEQDENKPVKLKSAEHHFAVMKERGVDLVSVNVSSMYHHSTEKNGVPGTLYVEESLDHGILYGGEVIVPADLAGDVLELLQTADFRFGRSKSAQYGACRLQGDITCNPVENNCIFVKEHEPVYAILLSDLLLLSDGINRADADSVRAEIALKAGLSDFRNQDVETGFSENCAYRQVGGYHNMWQMHKNVNTVVCAGSYYQLTGMGKEIPQEIRIGEYPQEGMGRILLIPQSEMSKMKSVREMQADTWDGAGTETSQEVLNAIISNAFCRSMRETALNYVKNHSELKSEVQIGRLRLMLMEAQDERDLVARVQSIKTGSRRKAALKLLRDLYDTNITTELRPDEPIPENCGLQMDTMLREDQELAELIRKQSDAKHIVEDNWKGLLSEVLKLAYYQVEKGDA